MPLLLKALGRIGGAEANAELHRWAEGDVDEMIVLAALCALAEQGDRSAIPLIEKYLSRPDRNSSWERGQLIEALKKLGHESPK